MKKFTLLLCVLSCILLSLKDKPYKKFLKKSSFVFIPSGHLETGDKEEPIAAFLMLSQEVTNYQYKLFIQDKYLSVGDSIGAKLAMPDTNGWIVNSRFGEPLRNYYFSHPAYRNYPVVNVSQKNAMDYCRWLTKKMMQIYPKQSFNDFRLPTKREWIYAARGGLENSPYPWGGPSTRNIKGSSLANFRVVGEHNLTADENGQPIIVDCPKYTMLPLVDAVFGPATTLSYSPNGYGLFNMSGNVAELVADEPIAMGGHWKSYGNDIQVTSQIDFEKANPFVGFRPVMPFLTQAK